MESFEIIRLRVGQLDSNCYIFRIGNNAIIIDPGEDPDFIIDKLQTKEIKPLAILATHGHFDHISAGFSVQAAFNTPFCIHKDDDFLVLRMRETTIHFQEMDPGPAPIVTKYLEKETELTVGEFKIKMIETPGHTPGSVSFYDKKRAVVFVGDLLFSDGSIGEVTHKYSDRNKVKTSIKKILSLPKETIVYSGHGEEASVKELREKFSWAL